ncbi:MAG TPA: kynureninase [Sphingomicrobium sp.]|nr:kynureninase [Sphingomicrobium sp.]
MILDRARDLDAADPLAFARERFHLPEGLIYLDGNSLGALPRDAPARIAETVEHQWGGDLITSWNKHNWIDWPLTVAARLAPIVGARANDLLIADSTSVCLFKLLVAAVQTQPDRRVILTEAGNFPTDQYVMQGIARLLPGVELRAVERHELIGAIDDDTAVVSLTHVDYRGGERLEMAAINASARASGALTVWDLSHSAGVLALDLAGSGCDLAVGCGYKYLNGGPGAPAFLYVSDRLQGRLSPTISGWMGHADPFAFGSDYRPADGIRKFLTGTPSIIALAALDAGLSTFDGIDMALVERKAGTLTGFFIDCVEETSGIDLAVQRDRDRHGGHVVVPHPHGYAVMQALIARGVVGDFRAPDLMRFGFSPLYTSFEDAWRAADNLRDILESGDWNDPRYLERRPVT